MRIQLSDHFSYKRLLRFVLPSILMIICTSVYSIVDGFFISNFVGKTPFAAINLIYPVLIAVGTLGFMAGTGGSAIVSKTLGEGKPEKANQYFSLLVYATLAFSILISVVGFIFIRPIAIVLGAEMTLQPGDRQAIMDRMQELAEQRKSKQPLEYPSAGSMFKRPEGFFAGKLIQDAGLAGYSVGGAQVSEKHCGFVINRGNATAKDVRELVRQVADRVEQTFGVRLEPEVRYLSQEGLKPLLA